MKWLLTVILLVLVPSVAHAYSGAEEAFRSIDKECYAVYEGKWRKMKNALLPFANKPPVTIAEIFDTQVCLPRSLLYDVVLLSGAIGGSGKGWVYTHYRCRRRGALWSIQHPGNPSTWEIAYGEITIEACKRLLRRTWGTK